MSPSPEIPAPARSDGASVQRVSFVLPAWNEELLLPGALDAIRRAADQIGLSHQIIVADDASTDRTADVARASGAEVVPCDHRQIAATRNSGARASDGDLLIFVDADTRVTADAVRAAVDAVNRGATYGGADVTWDGAIPLWSRALLRLTLLMYRFGKLASGAFLFCRRDAFERAGGFDESLYAAEEYYLSKRLKKLGRHAWVKDRVVTSGRKLRAHSSWELLRDTARLMLGGKRALGKREGLGLWYQERRPDPGIVGAGERDAREEPS